jgi:hypothetical protein
MTSSEVLPDDPLRAWDWRADLRRQERGIPWLARQTNRSQTTVYRYAYGTLPTPIGWLQDVARVLGKPVAA